MFIVGCWRVVGGWWLRLRRLLVRMGVALRVAWGGNGVAGWLVGSWGRVGEFHISQWSAFQSGGDSVGGRVWSISSGSARII